METTDMDTDTDTSILDYLESLKIPFEDIQVATNDFADENLIKEGTSFIVFKGQLRQSGELIHIVARMCIQKPVGLNEMVMSRLGFRHKTILTMFKYVSWNGMDIIIYKYEANESLDKHLSDPTRLTWTKRLNICIDVADALRDIHYGLPDDYSVIHGNIKSSKILLDLNWKPKLQGFGLANVVRKNKAFHIGKHNGTLEYMDPTIEKTNSLTVKSDVFSFGVVLFEVLLGRKATIPIPNDDNLDFVGLARSRYDAETLYAMIDPDLRNQMDDESLNVFSEAAYSCSKELRADRPDMDQILIRLKTALELQQTHDQTLTISKGAVEDTSPHQLKEGYLDHLKIPLSAIKLATDSFSQRYFVGSGGYGKVYKANLDHFDGNNSLATEGKYEAGFPKRNSTVAIKHITERFDGQGEQGFITEIELLSNCRHKNIVSLLGFCDENQEQILVYEYVSNGSLDDYLEKRDKRTNLTWPKRIQICLDIAHGLQYLHTSTENKKMIIHRDIKSANILLNDQWEAKIADFGLSKSHDAYLNSSTMFPTGIAGTPIYLDPEYQITGKLKAASDIYSFGVVLFEIMCGRSAYDPIYSPNWLPWIVHRAVNEGTLKQLVDSKIREADENIFMLNGGLNQDSFNTFSKIAYQCLAETQVGRPTMEVIIKELERALKFQVDNRDNLQISLGKIERATQNFSDAKCIEKGQHWKQYKGEITLANVCKTVVAKRWDKKSDQGNSQFLAELKVLAMSKHENIVSLVGYCNDMDERIIVYEHLCNGHLDKYLKDEDLRWMKRLKIGIDVACGLAYLHRAGDTRQTWMIHRDLKSSSILLDTEMNAKISNLELAANFVELKKVDHVSADNAFGSLEYMDPEYKQGYLTEKSDIYSLGVILFEILCGRLACDEDHSLFLGPLAKRRYKEGKLDTLVFECLKKQIDQDSLATYLKIAFQCLSDNASDRPFARDVVKKLKDALEFQEDYEIWEPKLPRDYKEIIQMSKTPLMYYNEKKKVLYNMLTKGILLQQSKVEPNNHKRNPPSDVKNSIDLHWFSLGRNGERNEMISAQKFSFKNREGHNLLSIPQSRFQKVVEMLIISNLNIKIKIRPQLLSPNVNYGVYLVFKFNGPRSLSSKSVYVNLTYKMRGETLHAYFATWRDEDWMTIEIFRFFNDKKHNMFEVLLERFSRYYCGNRAIYIEGIEFRAIDNVKHEEIEKISENDGDAEKGFKVMV